MYLVPLRNCIYNHLCYRQHLWFSWQGKRRGCNIHIQIGSSNKLLQEGEKQRNKATRPLPQPSPLCLPDSLSRQAQELGIYLSVPYSTCPGKNTGWMIWSQTNVNFGECIFQNTAFPNICMKCKLQLTLTKINQAVWTAGCRFLGDSTHKSFPKSPGARFFAN